MKYSFPGSNTLLFFMCSVFLTGLTAQNSDAVITNFKAFSFFNNEVVADSIVYLPENPVPGPAEYLADTLEVFTEEGTFTLNYLPDEEGTFVGIWLDLNENGLFEKEEQLYSGPAQGGLLSDTLNFPTFTDSRRVLVATSKNEGNLSDTREILTNDQISSLQFIIRAGPPTLTLGSKKDTRDTTENYCVEVPMELYLGPGHPCITVYKWLVEYPVSNTAQVNADVSLNPSGTPFAVGTMLNANDYVAFDFDFSAYPINDGDVVNFIFQYSLCSDPATLDMAVFSFTKDCTTGTRNDKRFQLNENLQLQISPNPVSGETKINYKLEAPGPVQLVIFDLQGRQLDILQQGDLPAGDHHLIYQANELPTGIYFLQLLTKNGFLSKKMMVSGR